MTVPRLAAPACSPGPQYHPVMGAVAPVPRICGREAEIGALGESLGRVAAGGPAIVLAAGYALAGVLTLLDLTVPAAVQISAGVVPALWWLAAAGTLLTRARQAPSTAGLLGGAATGHGTV